MEKKKLTKESLTEMMKEIVFKREQAKETFHRNDGAEGFCKYLLENFDFEVKEKVDEPNNNI